MVFHSLKQLGLQAIFNHPMVECSTAPVFLLVFLLPCPLLPYAFSYLPLEYFGIQKTGNSSRSK